MQTNEKHLTLTICKTYGQRLQDLYTRYANSNEQHEPITDTPKKATANDEPKKR